MTGRRAKTLGVPCGNPTSAKKHATVPRDPGLFSSDCEASPSLKALPLRRGWRKKTAVTDPFRGA